nr:hypothetical protein [Amycolatopsis sp. 195334CR]
MLPVPGRGLAAFRALAAVWLASDAACDACPAALAATRAASLAARDAAPACDRLRGAPGGAGGPAGRVARLDRRIPGRGRLTGRRLACFLGQPRRFHRLAGGVPGDLGLLRGLRPRLLGQIRQLRDGERLVVAGGGDQVTVEQERAHVLDGPVERGLRGPVHRRAAGVHDLPDPHPVVVVLRALAAGAEKGHQLLHGAVERALRGRLHPGAARVDQLRDLHAHVVLPRALPARGEKRAQGLGRAAERGLRGLAHTGPALGEHLPDADPQVVLLGHGEPGGEERAHVLVGARERGARGPGHARPAGLQDGQGHRAVGQHALCRRRWVGGGRGHQQGQGGQRRQRGGQAPSQ